MPSPKPASDAHSIATSPPNSDSESDAPIRNHDPGKFVASDSTLSFYQKETTVTGRRVPVMKRKHGEARFLFQKITKTTETLIETTKQAPGEMVIDKNKKVPPIQRPFTPHASDGGRAQHYRVIRRFFPNEDNANAIAGPSRAKGTCQNPIEISDDKDTKEGNGSDGFKVVVDMSDSSSGASRSHKSPSPPDDFYDFEPCTAHDD